MRSKSETSDKVTPLTSTARRIADEWLRARAVRPSYRLHGFSNFCAPICHICIDLSGGR